MNREFTLKPRYKNKKARDAYYRVLKEVEKNSQNESGKCEDYISEMKKSEIFNEEEMIIARKLLYCERLVHSCFFLSGSEEIFLAVVCMEILTDAILLKHKGVEFCIIPAIVNFNSGSAEHYVLRVVFTRLKPERKAFLHLDIGSRIYDSGGLSPDTVVYGPPGSDELSSYKVRRWIDELDDDSMKLKKKNKLYFTLWRSIRDRFKFLKMVGRGLKAKDRIAIHLSIGRVIGHWEN